MTPERLAEIKARAEAATSGPWDDGCSHAVNGEFIAHARQDIPDLVAEVERLRAALSDIASGIRWGEDTAIKREINRIQDYASSVLARN